MDLPILTHESIVLRRPEPADAEARLRAGSDPELTRLYGGDPRTVRPLTPEDAQRWYEHTLAEPYGWVITVAGDCVGHARLHSLQEADRRARYAVGIFDRRWWGRGVGTWATRLVLRYAFETLGLHRVDLRVLEYNERAIACYSKCGFQREGLERESALVAGEWYSDVMMSILDREYAALAPSWWGR